MLIAKGKLSDIFTSKISDSYSENKNDKTILVGVEFPLKFLQYMQKEK